MHQQPTVQEYQARTINDNNRARFDILPAFPRVLIQTAIERTDQHYSAPLLANVPNHLLTEHERQRRLPKAYSDAFELKLNSDVATFFDFDEMSFIYTLYDIFFNRYSRQWNIDTNILDYNLVRLQKCLDKILAMLNIEPTLMPFSSREWPIALEFYLQIDVDLFYMKTCSFRGASFHDDKDPWHSNDIDQHLFCRDAPKANFGMLPCDCKTCLCCHPSERFLQQQTPLAVQFSANHIHRFLNKYEAILNCPAVSI
ncbi:unnamed protein product [Rotaria sp. Silwood2]|nr:unnamed protein product [Rotaria sp. Silwood2]